MPNFAANVTMMFTEWEFLDRFAAAADAGFTAVEFQFPYAFAVNDIAAKVERAGVKVAMFNLPPGNFYKGDRGLAALAERRDEFRASVALARRYAQALQVDRLHVMAGVAGASARPAFVHALCYALDRLEPLTLLIEPLNGRDFPGYFLNDFDLAADLIGEVGSPRLKLQYDFYHRQILRGDVAAGLEALMPIVGHVQAASVPRRAEPGSGELDDFYLFRRLDELGYAGHVGAEYRPAAGTLAGLGWFERAAAQAAAGSPASSTMAPKQSRT